jgi:predicted ferric reductase
LPGRCDYNFTGKINSGHCFLGLKILIVKKDNLIFVVLVLFGAPLLLWAAGDFPRRTILKETISLVTLLAFTMMIGQFFLSRGNRKMMKIPGMAKVIKTHKIFGYVFAPVLLLHPFFIVFPRYFESGVEPLDAFVTLLTAFNSTGVILGMVAWLLLLIIVLTSIFRYRLSIKYISWRLLHGILSMLFLIVASWHAIDMGRHSNVAMSVFIIILSGSGFMLLLKTYFSKSHKKLRIKQ